MLANAPEQLYWQESGPDSRPSDCESFITDGEDTVWRKGGDSFDQDGSLPRKAVLHHLDC